MPLALLLTDDEHIPLYLQVVHQIRYLIISRELVAGAQLPPVRELAGQNGINSGTVALAYRTLQQEGLVKSRRGRGTFVSSAVTETSRLELRQSLLTEALADLVGRAYALGFDAAGVRQHLGTQLQRQLRRVPLVMVMPSVPAADKYSRLVAQVLPASVVPTFHSASIKHLESGEAATVAAYAEAYFTLTFSTLVPRVDAALRTHSLRSEVVGITAQLTAATKASLGRLTPSSAHVLVTESRNVGSALTLLAQYSNLDVRGLAVLTESSPAEAWDRHSAATHLYTFGMMPHLERRGVKESHRFQLEFTLTEESAGRLRAMLTAPNGPTTFQASVFPSGTATGVRGLPQGDPPE